MQVTLGSSVQRSVGRRFLPALSVTALALMLAACGGDAATDAGSSGAGGQRASKASAKFDSSLSDAPCSVVTVDAVASVFGLPAEEIKQRGTWGMCLYSWKGDGQVMDATIHVTRVSETAAEAEKHFAHATAGMSGAEVDAAMDSLRDQMRKNEGEGNTAEAGGAAAEVLLGAAGGGGSSGMQFRDVPGIGDQARMQVGSGDLSVLYGNLQFSVTAYHGGSMPMPDDFSGASGMMAHSQAWLESVLPQREEQTIALARAAVAAL